MDRITIQITESQARLIELLLERGEQNSPMDDAEFSTARQIERAIRVGRYNALLEREDAPTMREP